MILRPFRAAWAAWQQLKELGDPFDIPDWPIPDEETSTDG